MARRLWDVGLDPPTWRTEFGVEFGATVAAVAQGG
jgi:hypothetical protein